MKKVRSLSVSNILIFLIWPFFGLLSAIRNNRQPWAMNLFWLFCIFFGMSFVISSSGPDSFRYALSLVEYHNLDISFGDFLKQLYTLEYNTVDILQPFITFLISRVTADSKILYGVFGLIFGYFYSRNIWMLLNHPYSAVKRSSLSFLIVFILLNPIWYINGFRMYCATHVFLFGLLQYLLYNRWNMLTWAFLSPLVHFSFLLPVSVFTIYLLLGNRVRLYFWFFILTGLITELNIEPVRNFISLLPDVFRIRAESYTDKTYISNVTNFMAGASWYIYYSTKVLTWIVYAFVTVIYFFERDQKTKKTDLQKIFCFGLLFYGVANLVQNIPSGGRFLTVANLLIFAFLFIYFSDYNPSRLLNLALFFSLPLIFLFSVVQMRIGFEYMGVLTIIGNPFAVFFANDSASIMDLIKGAI